MGEVETRMRPAPQVDFPDWPASWGVRPKYVTLAHPERLTYGPAIQRVAKSLGGDLFPWQRYAVSLGTEQIPDGLGGWEPAYDTVIILVTRRGGKTFMVKATSVERGLRGKARIAYTAQTRDEARKRWLELADNPSDVPADLHIRMARDKQGRLIIDRQDAGSELRPPFLDERRRGADPEHAWLALARPLRRAVAIVPNEARQRRVIAVRLVSLAISGEPLPCHIQHSHLR